MPLSAHYATFATYSHLSIYRRKTPLQIAMGPNLNRKLNLSLNLNLNLPR